MLISVAAALHPSVSRAGDLNEQKALKVKAAYLYNFAKFVTWPKSAFENGKSPFVIGILGYDPFGGILDRTVKGKTVDDRLVTTQRFDWLEIRSREALRRCHILYISSSESFRLQEILYFLRGKPVLVVGASRGFGSAGGTIGFVVRGGRILFEINRGAAMEAKLKVSAKLLELGLPASSGPRFGG